jgi:hypothetical protein
MRTNKTLIILFAVLLIAALLTSCAFKPKPKGSKFKCPDGRIVLNLTECEDVQEQDNTTQQPNITRPPIINTTQNTTRNFSTLRKKEENTTANATGNSLPNLNGWSIEEIIGGMSSYNEKFIGAFGNQISYTSDGKSYSIGTGYKSLPDPFWIARGPYHAGVKEYNVNSFRTSLPQTPYEFYDMVQGKHNDSKFKLVYPDQWTEWDKIKCEKTPSCRTIEAVTCTKENHTLTVWTHNTPGQAYTEATRYTMQAVDDKRETLTTFEQFYCTPV